MAKTQRGARRAPRRARRRAPPPPRRRGPGRRGSHRAPDAPAAGQGRRRPPRGSRPRRRRVAAAAGRARPAAAAPATLAGSLASTPVEVAPRRGEIAGLDIALHQIRHRPDVAAVGVGRRGPRALRRRPRCGPGRAGSRSPGSPPSPWPRGRPACAGARPPGAARAQSLAREVDPAELEQQPAVVRARGAARRPPPPRPGRCRSSCMQEAGVAQAFRQRLARDLDRARQLLAGELAAAGALVGQRHDRHGLRVVRRLGLGQAHVLDRLVRARRRRSPCRACSFSASTLLGSPSSTVAMSAAALGGAAGLGQHLRQRHLQVAGAVGGGGAFEQLAQRRDAGVLAALGEVEPGQRPLERPRIAGARCRRRCAVAAVAAMRA